MSRHLAEHKLTWLVDDALVVVSELATNAMKHAQTPFTVIVHRDQSSVYLIVQDESAVMPAWAPASTLALAGRGLVLVSVLSRDWGVSAGDGRKSVWARFDLQHHHRNG